MARRRRDPDAVGTSFPTARSPEMREQQMISLATDLVERQIREGTASAQVLVHYLKLATRKEELELKNLEARSELLKAQVDAQASAQRTEELYKQALKAMRVYAGQDDEDDDDY